MEDKSKTIQNMFNDIAPRYDLLNRVLSFKRDVTWRRIAVKSADIKPGMCVLDLACGTGDVIAEIKKQAPETKIIGGDFSLNMLKLAKEKINDIPFSAADAHSLPFKDETFDRITMAFGFRNVTDKEKGLKEFHRVMKKGGKLCILEFSQPENKIFDKIYKFYFTKILPIVGGLVSGNKKAYAYLPDSVYKFPKRPEYRKMIENAGFVDADFKSLMLGAVTIALITK